MMTPAVTSLGWNAICPSHGISQKLTLTQDYQCPVSIHHTATLTYSSNSAPPRFAVRAIICPNDSSCRKVQPASIQPRLTIRVLFEAPAVPSRGYGRPAVPRRCHRDTVVNTANKADTLQP